jgi:hypothetical protein
MKKKVVSPIFTVGADINFHKGTISVLRYHHVPE